MKEQELGSFHMINNVISNDAAFVPMVIVASVLQPSIGRPLEGGGSGGGGYVENLAPPGRSPSPGQSVAGVRCRAFMLPSHVHNRRYLTDYRRIAAGQRLLTAADKAPSVPLTNDPSARAPQQRTRAETLRAAGSPHSDGRPGSWSRLCRGALGGSPSAMADHSAAAYVTRPSPPRCYSIHRGKTSNSQNAIQQLFQ